MGWRDGIEVPLPFLLPPQTTHTLTTFIIMNSKGKLPVLGMRTPTQRRVCDWGLSLALALSLSLSLSLTQALTHSLAHSFALALALTLEMVLALALPLPMDAGFVRASDLARKIRAGPLPFFTDVQLPLASVVAKVAILAQMLSFSLCDA
jgi:hypothetical protein